MRCKLRTPITSQSSEMPSETIRPYACVQTNTRTQILGDPLPSVDVVDVPFPELSQSISSLDCRRILQRIPRRSIARNDKFY